MELSEALWILEHRCVVQPEDKEALEVVKQTITALQGRANHPWIRDATQWMNESLRMRKELEAETKAGDMHRELNRRVAEALGQKFGETWHDLPEKVVALWHELNDACGIEEPLK